MDMRCDTVTPHLILLSTTPGAKAPSPLSALPAHSIISARARSLWRSDMAPAVARCLAVFASSRHPGCL